MDQEIQTGILIGQRLIKFLKRDKGYYLDFDGHIKPKHDQEQGILNFPWIFNHKAGRMKCPLWLTLHFGCFNTIPQYCIEKCWKVVVIPTSVQRLFWIQEYLQTQNIESKSGLDLRNFTFGMYRAFAYFDNRKEAKDLEKQLLRTCVKDKKYYDIFTKRGCTEYENKLPSMEWTVGDDQPAFEELLTHRVDHGYGIKERIKIQKFNQPLWLKHIIKLNWAQSAYAAGDRSWKTTPYASYVQTSKNPTRY